MDLNHVTVIAADLDSAWDFYTRLGLIPIVDHRPTYIRFRNKQGNTTFSVDQGVPPGEGTTVYFETDDLENEVQRIETAGLSFTSQPTDQPWRWREAELYDPAGNRIVLYFAGDNRLNPS